MTTRPQRTDSATTPPSTRWSARAFGAAVTVGTVLLGNSLGPHVARSLIHYAVPREVPLIFALLTLVGSPVLLGLGFVAAYLYRTKLQALPVALRVAGLVVTTVVTTVAHYGIGLLFIQ